jgi:DNA-binding transcriptional regulator YhcF (GntR family)
MTITDTMLLQINYKSGKPVYLQVVDQIRAAAASGHLQTGEPLPAIRPLAEELRVNRNTIAKAYTELESQGVIETLPGKGCFLKANNSPLKKDVRRKLLIEEIDQAVVQAHHFQVPRGEFLELVRERLDALEDKKRINDTQKSN